MISRILGIFNRAPDIDCEHVQNLSSDYVDGDLDHKQEDKMKAHLEWCAPCLALINTLRATIGLLGSTPEVEAPPALRERLHDMAQKEQGR